jgi:NADH:ubiquinone oxidoreductase subunit F (NADH-binding)/Pyruvate/2-oxoacid:ferredoxin oxidoreductase delta subunit
VINNVETLANLPPILLHGVEAYAARGTEKSKGTKIFALAGKVNNTGLVEVPIGTPLRDVVFGVGGGIPGGREFKAVQIGGPSGGCVPTKHLDLAVDYESLTSIGSMMGSGGMIVVDEDTCIVDVARYFLNFVQNESCGKCTPCRLGTLRMLEILNRITEGKGSVADLDQLVTMGKAIKDSSLCGLGQTAPNPVLSTLNFFRDEYEAHVVEKRCPALVCKSLLTYEIDLEPCTGCGICARNCPVTGIVKVGDQKKYAIEALKCIRCGVCFDLCKFESVVRKSEGICATNS